MGSPFITVLHRVYPTQYPLKTVQRRMRIRERLVDGMCEELQTFMLLWYWKLYWIYHYITRKKKKRKKSEPCNNQLANILLVPVGKTTTISTAKCCLFTIQKKGGSYSANMAAISIFPPHSHVKASSPLFIFIFFINSSSLPSLQLINLVSFRHTSKMS